MLYLDPHHTRPALLPDKETHQLSQAAIATCHTRRLRRLPIEQMDPSMLIGFLLRDEQDFQAWREAMSRVPGKTIVHFSLPAHPKHSAVGERSGAIDEVESIDDDDESLA